MKRNINGIYFFILILIFGLIMAYISSFDVLYYVDTNKYFKNVTNKESNTLTKLLDEQDKTSNMIKEASQSDKYSLDNPFILVNPYKVNPLSAIMVFKTKESVSVELYINDLLMTTFSSSTEHIIPIYGLYSNTNNFVTLKTSNNDTNTVKITTEEYDSNIGNINISKELNGNSNMFLLGSLNKSENTLRGFDYNANLVYYLKLDYISSFSIINDKWLLTYNQEYSNKELSNDLILQMDYLGHIESISENNNKILYTHNQSIDNQDYLSISGNLYNKNTKNYFLVTRINNIRGKNYSSLYTKKIEDYLDKAKLYDKKVNININGNRIDTNINIEEKNVSMLLVSKNSKYTYMYYLVYNGGMFDNSFVFDKKGEYSLFLKIDENYYNLNTIINIE